MNEAGSTQLQQTGMLSIRALIDLRADTTPDAAYLIDPAGGVTTTYAHLRERTAAVAAALARHGLPPGSKVAYAMTNCPDTACIILGIMYAGCTATAINLVAGNDTISYVLGHSGAKLAFVQPHTRELVEQALQTSDGKPQLLEVSPALFEVAPSGSEPAAVNSDDDGLLMYTSGTTGRPKGVVLRQSSLLAGGMNAAIAHQLTPEDRAMCVLPLYHINGLCVTVFGPLVSGGSVVMPAKFSVSSFWQIIEQYDCTWFSVVPTQISYLLHDTATDPAEVRALHRLRFGRSASAPLATEVQEAFEARFGVPIVETMGLTETAAQILSNPLPPGVRKIGSPGVAVGNEVIIADTGQREVARGTEGEVLVRGANVMRLYLDNEEATSQALTADGWLRTGDLGRMDEDGYVFITGRLKELIIKGGENIAPREVDEALYAHPEVIEAAAFACACKHYGQRVEAGVALREGATVTEQELVDLCKRKIGSFKSPDRIHFFAELPKGPSGKIQRRKLQELFGG
jgi:acyl-CoA synthetase (AMP-forming)/AMP-acid ligase II